ncbi:MAG: phage tail protein [Bacillota bacterium]
MDPFIAEIRIFAGNFAPRGWALCDGQLMPLSQNTALFSLLGTTYGGNGKSNFALPDLQGRAPMMWGQGQDLSNHVLGEAKGSSSITLLRSEVPSHSHTPACFVDGSSTSSPQGNVWAPVREGASGAYGSPVNLVAMSPQALAMTGGNQPHNNMQPYLTLNFIIALEGVYPPRP